MCGCGTYYYQIITNITRQCRDFSHNHLKYYICFEFCNDATYSHQSHFDFEQVCFDNDLIVFLTLFFFWCLWWIINIYHALI